MTNEPSPDDDVPASQRTIRWVSGILAIVALVAIIARWGCNDNSLVIGIGAILVILGKVAFEDIFAFWGGRK